MASPSPDIYVCCCLLFLFPNLDFPFACMYNILPSVAPHKTLPRLKNVFSHPPSLPAYSSSRHVFSLLSFFSSKLLDNPSPPLPSRHPAVVARPLPPPLFLAAQCEEDVAPRPLAYNKHHTPTPPTRRPQTKAGVSSDGGVFSAGARRRVVYVAGGSVLVRLA